MDIFKLIFEHDLRLDQLRERHLDRSTQEVSMSIEDFMKPDPTYSKFYITGTELDEPSFGVNRLEKYQEIVESIDKALSDFTLYAGGETMKLDSALSKTEIGQAIILTKKEEMVWNPELLSIHSGSNVGHKKSEIAEVLETGDLVLYKEKAHHGFDLHLFSKENIYPKLFYPLRKLTDPQFRFFSINGKRITSERKFYFETWTLQRPPHGAEEVFKSTEL